ncbi:putative HRQ family protein 2 [Hirsutella rhossiliensis]|uniref:HRQ family protein 2 n=1 Tax=Hirsutella rhossiliensis TaxID=111463 RepID=A0A9P8MV50_9HYPO|nr:putative HRQ family protein 2 [Hirsutella rhossiliensis]KAH0962683.1 putative HRQ family protein 2 [Hirsutella rhossiliensis]
MWTQFQAAWELPSAVVLGFLMLLAGIAHLYRASKSPSSPHKDWDQDRPGKPDETIIQPLKDFDWIVEEPQKFRPFKPVYHISMGLQSDTPSGLITIDKDYLDRVNLRRGLIRQHGDKVHGYMPAGAEGVRELYAFLMGSYLPTRFPTIFQLSSDKGQIRNVATGRTHPTAATADPAAALRAIGETVEEDMFLLHDTPEGHKSVAFVCCFAAGFDPSTKLGKGLKQIHGPVPSFDKIGPSMERFFARLQVGKNVKRLNWVVQTHGELLVCDSHATHNAGKGHGEIDFGQTFLRVELQTLSRLPQTRAVLFSFKTYMYPIRQIKDEGLGSDLAAAVEGMKEGNAPGMWLYKGGELWAETVCEYLRA